MQNINPQKNISKKKSLIYALVIILIGTVLGVGGWWYTNQDVIAKVGNKKITKKDLNRTIYAESFKGTVDNPEEVNKEKKKEIVKRLIENVIVEEEAGKLAVSVSDEEINDAITERITGYEKYTDVQKDLMYENIKASLLKEKVKEKVVAWKEGKYIVARFDMNYPGLVDPSIATFDEVDQAKVDADKVYAKNLIDSIYQDIQSGTISFEEGMKKVDNDKRIGRPAWGSLTPAFSGYFTKQQYEDRTAICTFTEIQKEAANLKKEGISSVFTVKGQYVKNMDDMEGETVEKEGNYTILQVSQSNNASFTTYEVWLENQKSERVKWVSKAYAVGTCTGGLVPTGSNNFAAIYMRTNYYNAAGGGPFPLSGVQFEIRSEAGGTFNSVTCGNSLPCQQRAIIDSRNSPYTCNSFMQDWTNGSGELKLGYVSCGGNGFSFSCSCNDYSFWAQSNGPGNGYWEDVQYPEPNKPVKYISVAGNGMTTDAWFTWREVGPVTSSNLRCDIYDTDPNPNSTVIPGQEIIYKVAVRNFGNAAANQVLVEIPAPEGTEFVRMTSGCTGRLNCNVRTGDCGKVITCGFNSGSIPTFGAVPHAYWWFSEMPKQGDSYWEWGELLLTVRVKNPPGVTRIDNRAQTRKTDNSEIYVSDYVHHNISLPDPHVFTCVGLTVDGDTAGFAPFYANFTANAYDSDGHSIKYYWDFDGDSNWDVIDFDNTKEFMYTTSGTYQVKVKAECQSWFNSCEMTITIEVESSIDGEGNEVSP